MINKRVFVRSKKKCPFKCSYCFAELGCYNQQISKLLTMDSLELTDKSAAIIYPSCDSEIFLDDNNIELIKHVISECDHPIVSFSTKKKLPSSQLDKLSLLDKILKEKKGFLKVSVSISNKNMLSSVEGGTSSFEERLKTMENIMKRGIASSVNLKPILPFVSIDEYFDIINAFRKYTQFFMLGPLYVDKTTSFGSDIIEKYPDLISTRKVSWLPDIPEWLVCENTIMIDKIKNWIILGGAFWFDSDRFLINKLIANGVNDG